VRQRSSHSVAIDCRLPVLVGGQRGLGFNRLVGKRSFYALLCERLFRRRRSAGRGAEQSDTTGEQEQREQDESLPLSL
jgi:hypothetical protein